MKAWMALGLAAIAASAGSGAQSLKDVTESYQFYTRAPYEVHHGPGPGVVADTRWRFCFVVTFHEGTTRPEGASSSMTQALMRCTVLRHTAVEIVECAANGSDMVSAGQVNWSRTKGQCGKAR